MILLFAIELRISERCYTSEMVEDLRGKLAQRDVKHVRPRDDNFRGEVGLLYLR